MRVWDIPPDRLCRQHLLGQHNEIHSIWGIITGEKRGFARHPEVMRWRGKLRALYLRHDDTVAEMLRRGYRHHSPLPEALAAGPTTQDTLWESIEQQVEALRRKGCECLV